MIQNQLSFESENLSIHYICFNIQGFIELKGIKKIAFYQFEVKVQILQLLAQPRPKKEFDVEKFLAPFDGLSNSKKTKIKKLFIEGIDEEIENRSLKLKFQIIQKDTSVKNTNLLVPISLTKSKYIFFYENIDSKSFLKNF